MLNYSVNEKNKLRKNNGSIFIFMLCSVVIFVLLFFMFCQITIFILASQICAGAVDAASLAAAQEMSEIVIEDPYFGFVGLSDACPGKRTLNSAAEPVPVKGINTIIATCRSNLLIANKLNNEYMVELAQKDVSYAKECSALLQKACLESLKEKPKDKILDRDGNLVKVYEKAKYAYLNNLKWAQEFSKFKKFQLVLGWLDGPCSSTVELPLPLDLADIDEKAKCGSEYCAFKNVAVDKTAFYFAGLADKSSLVSTSQFRSLDSARLCTIIRVNSELQFSNKYMLLGLDKLNLDICNSSCSLPTASKNVSPPTVLVVQFPHGRTSNFTNFADILKSFSASKDRVTIQHPENGDYPDETSAQLVESNMSEFHVCPSVDALIAKGFYDWLRSCQGKARIDSILEMLDKPFPLFANSPQTISYTLTEDGQIALSCERIYDSQTIHENQSYAVSHAAQAKGKTWTFIWRDQVSRLGKNGGKHYGLPLVDKKNVSNWEKIYPHNGLAVAMEFSSPM